MTLRIPAIILLTCVGVTSATAEVKQTDVATVGGLVAKGPGSKLGDQVNDENPGCGQSGSCTDVCLTLASDSVVDAVEPRVRTKGYEWAKCWRHRNHLWWDCNAEYFRFYPGEPHIFSKEGYTWVCMQARNWGNESLEAQLVVTFHSPSTHANQATLVHTYTVVKGDTLESIALRLHLGPGWQRLYEANRKSIRDANTIVPGQILVLP